MEGRGMVCAEPTEEASMDWLQGNWAVGVAVSLALFALLILRRGSRNTSLDWGTLASFLRGNSPIERIELDERERTKVDVGVRLRETFGSATYKRSDRHGVRIETLNILRVGEARFMVIFRDEKLIHFKRVGGREIRNPQFNAQHSMILLELLHRVRRLAEKK